MSVFSVQRLWAGRRQGFNATLNDLTACFRVTTQHGPFDQNYFPTDERDILNDTYTFCQAQVPQTVFFPRIGDPYQGPARISGAGSRRDDDLACSHHRVVVDQDDPRLFLIECDYTSDKQSIPPIAVPTINHGAIKVQRVAYRAYQRVDITGTRVPVAGDPRIVGVDPLVAGVSIVNAALEMYSPQPLREVNIPTISIQRWVDAAAWDIASPAKYTNRLNDDVTFGNAIGTVKVDKVTADYKPFYPNPMYDVHIELQIDPDGWWLPILNVGYRQRIVDGVGASVLRHMTDAEGHRVSTPWPLDANGAQIVNPTLNTIVTQWYRNELIMDLSPLLAGLPGV